MVCGATEISRGHCRSLDQNEAITGLANFGSQHWGTASLIRCTNHRRTVWCTVYTIV
jgi:hypothetical protein